MSALLHTPGPWRFQVSSPREAQFLRTHWCVGQLLSPAKGVAIAFGDTEANARLIAAAPNLLEALRKIAEAHKFNTAVLLPTQVHEICHYAIEEATQPLSSREKPLAFAIYEKGEVHVLRVCRAFADGAPDEVIYSDEYAVPLFPRAQP